MKFRLAYVVMLGAIWSHAALAQDEMQPVTSALTKCISSFSPTIPPVSDSKTVPPGLIEGLNVNAVALHGTGGQAYSYFGTNPHVFTCGIAIYGPVSASLQKEIGQIVASDKSKTGLSGVAMVTKEPGKNAPTLEIEYHKRLLQ